MRLQGVVLHSNIRLLVDSKFLGVYQTRIFLNLPVVWVDLGVGIFFSIVRANPNGKINDFFLSI